MLYLGSGPSLGRPRWLMSTTAAPWSSRYWMVGNAARMRASSVMAPVFLSCDPLQSTRTRARLPCHAMSLIDFLFMVVSLMENERGTHYAPRSQKDSLGRQGSLDTLLFHVGDQVADAAAVAPLVVVPCHDLD